MTYKTSDFFYNLPPELIAQKPAKPRDHSRLLVLNKKTGMREHQHFYDIINYLRPGDLLVLNNSKVFPAR
ncbi:MAG TPA: S-adenosylmethionine:tRNA ribosyltransferase-isomerase, partial [Candidatus Saccharimonadales bacterium]|nr:S-adenosylmethionine:tRNA ribosyltransferase-isomerase [Candidatus Saccharimonadales bacterium]